MYVKSICDKIDDLIKAGVDTSSTQFKDWYDEAEKHILDNYGKESEEYKKFTGIMFFPWIATTSTLSAASVDACKRGLLEAKDLFCR